MSRACSIATAPVATPFHRRGVDGRITCPRGIAVWDDAVYIADHDAGLRTPRTAPPADPSPRHSVTGSERPFRPLRPPRPSVLAATECVQVLSLDGQMLSRIGATAFRGAPATLLCTLVDDTLYAGSRVNKHLFAFDRAGTILRATATQAATVPLASWDSQLLRQQAVLRPIHSLCRHVRTSFRSFASVALTLTFRASVSFLPLEALCFLFIFLCVSAHHRGWLPLLLCPHCSIA